ncbi:SDR family NAD(P)-dependent oxidoreductase [Helicobacter vulpis]|uniref:SDR family NAD(P)-dependent oxidoreductase n=1 Tax=Helicobacter vulpis TaxID=2316076 RepID=UPI000EADB403|nr:SDR family NAD(P)-dependent oxidoreductase [Helicobacter vulpis]
MKKYILVTGTTSGLGLAIAKAFLEENFIVFGTGRRIELLEELQNGYRESFIPLCFDIQDKNATQQAINKIFSTTKQLDCLINNAGLALGLEKAFECDLSDWETMVETNINGLLRITRLVLPSMVKNDAGTIINIGSIAGTYPYLGGNVYGASKAFVKQFSLNLRADLIGTKIRVSNIEPGLCSETDFSLVRFKGNREKAKAVYENKTTLKPQDIANIVLWIYKQPLHVNINSVEIMPINQTFSQLVVK